MDIFTLRLNKLLTESKVTKYKLAKDLKCSKQTVCNWCDGIEPKISHLRQIAEYFDVSADYLIGLEDERGNKTSIRNSFNNFNNNGNINF